MIALQMPRLALAPIAFAVIGVAVLALGWRDWQRLAMLPPVSSDALSEQAEVARDAGPVAARAGLDRLPLFGTVEASPEQAAPPPAPVVDEAALPESIAGYRLFGIIEADLSSSARAILGSGDSDQQEYRVGDAMPDGARIHAVRERAVILERDGQLERLALPPPEEGADAASPGFMPGELPGMRPGQRPPARFARPNYARPPMPVAPPMPPIDVPPPVEAAPTIPDMPMEPTEVPPAPP